MVTVAGLPLHPLAIHAVVVLVPLAALGAVLLAVRPRWGRPLGIPALLVGIVAVAAVPVATLSGEQLRDALPGPNPLIAVHEQRAGSLLPVAIVFLLLLAGAVLAGRRADAGRGSATAARVTAVLAALAGLAAAGLVVWIGHAGALAVWQGVVRS